MNISMTPAVLIELAKQKSGMELQAMADELHVDNTRISKLKKGRLALTPTEGFYFCTKAGLDFLDVMAELETNRDPDNARIWRAVKTPRTGYKL